MSAIRKIPEMSRGAAAEAVRSTTAGLAEPVGPEMRDALLDAFRLGMAEGLNSFGESDVGRVTRMGALLRGEES